MHVVVVGQTPPPYHGQAIMIQRLLEQSFEGFQLHHVRMGFSREMDEVGNFQLRKVGHLFSIISRVIWIRLRTGAVILYYPPASPQRVPFYRDLVLLMSFRWMFNKTIFRFEACGLTDMYSSLNRIEKLLFRAAYREPDVVIRLAKSLPEDGRRLGARREFIVPNAIPDLPRNVQRLTIAIPTILFVGVVRRSKGVEVLLRAAGQLRKRGIAFCLEFVGEAASLDFATEAKRIAIEEEIDDAVVWRGLLIGDEIEQAYSQADIFCFPTFVGSEAMPIVLMEAMRSSLPVVSTKWRAIPEMVRDDVTGILVPIQDPAAVADALEELLTDEDLRHKMGAEGRDLYEERFTMDHFRKGTQQALEACLEGHPRAFKS